MTLHSTADALPDATIQAAVFEDVSPVNGAPDVPAERGLAGLPGAHRRLPRRGDHRRLRQSALRHRRLPEPVLRGVGRRGRRPPCAADAAGRCPVDPPAAFPGAVVEGKLKIPNLGPNRYALSITPPDGSGWVQTTTLEGNLDWDAWVMEGATGLDTEFVVAGEPFPAVIFGYVPGGLEPDPGRRHRPRDHHGPGREGQGLRPDHRRRGRPPRHHLGRHGRRQAGAAHPRRRGWPSPTSPTATPPSGSAGPARPTAPSPPRTCRPAPTR